MNACSTWLSVGLAVLALAAVPARTADAPAAPTPDALARMTAKQVADLGAAVFALVKDHPTHEADGQRKEDCDLLLSYDAAARKALSRPEVASKLALIDLSAALERRSWNYCALLPD